ncbi:MAG: polysaccharide deacetylase [Deltaproteobacteria bacterium]|nr:MAG: polysaccharide deacetylase [Deltaproteobacteria bacterium]
MWGKINKAVSDPVWLAYRLRALLDRRGLWRRYASLAGKAGLQRLYFILSLDCDTVDDIAVVSEVHARLLDLGVKPVYAVPGELLRKGAKVYRGLMESGAEFINHGFTEHMYFDARRGAYESCFFYDRLPREQVRQDILAGDACLREVLGVVPQGFRAPHFGAFQKPEQLRFLHGVLKELDYRFSTSTMPFYSFRHGPVFSRFGIREIPVSGRDSSPLNILDSWTFFAASGHGFSPGDYFREGEAAADNYRHLGVGLLNYYVDPSHVHQQEAFYQTVDNWRRLARPVNYREFLEEIS